MKKLSIYIFAILVFAVTMSSCREDETETLSPYISESLSYRYPSDQFKCIWYSMVTSYGMWGIDDTDWDEVYDNLYPEFLKLDNEYKEGTPVATLDLANLYVAAFKTIRDHHLSLSVYNLWTGNNASEGFTIRPGMIEISEREEYHERHLAPELYSDDLSDFPVVQHLQSLGNRVSDLYYGKFEYDSEDIIVISALIDGTIPYLYFSAFYLSGLYNNAEMYNNYPDAAKAYLSFRTNVLELEDVDGVIVDVRDNGGGALSDEELLLGLMVDKEVQIGYTRYKAGLGRYDYTPWVPFVYTPLQNGVDEDGNSYINVRENYENPIVVLCNLYSVSMSEISSILTKNLPNGVVIGERTFGGHGQLSARSDVYYTGTFGNAAGPHYCSMTDHTFKTVDGEILEGIGVTPDIEMTFNINDLTNGSDTWIDRAITYIETGE